MRLPRLAAVGLAIGLTLPALPSFAASDAVTLVTEFCDATLKIVNDQRIGAVDRERRFRGLVGSYLDFPAIATFVLGRFWQKASESERQEFTEAFEENMVRAYIARFKILYRGETIRVRGARPDGAGVTIVPVEILRPDARPPLILEWKVQGVSPNLRIHDVSVSGVSMARTYRDEFASVILRSNGQLAVLIAALREKPDED